MIEYKKQFLRGLQDYKDQKEYGNSDAIKDPTVTLGLLYKQGWDYAKDVSPASLDRIIETTRKSLEPLVRPAGRNPFNYSGSHKFCDR